MSQPVDIPRWTDATPANRVEPTNGRKDTGWGPEERPASEHLDWLLYVIYLWVIYLKNLAGEALTWTAQQTFNLAPHAPDYKFSTARTTCYGWEGSENLGGGGVAWVPFGQGNMTETGATPQTLAKNIPLEQGDTVTTVTVDCQEGLAVAGAIRATLFRVASDGSSTVQLDQKSSAASVVAQTLVLDATLNGGAVGNGNNFLAVHVDAGAGAASVGPRALNGLRVTRTR